MKSEHLYRIAEAANSEGSLKEMLRTVHETLAELMPASHFSVAIYDAATQKFDFPYCQDEHGPHAPCAEEQGKGLTDDVQRTGRPLLVPDPATFAALSASGEVNHGQLSALSWVGVPLVKSQRTIGVLAAQIYSGAARFTQPDLALLQFVSTQVAHAIERKQSVERLRASEERFRALLENTADGVAVVTADGAVLYRSPAALQMLGYSADELTSDISAYAHPEDLELLRRTLAEVMAKPRVPVVAQIRARHKSGSWRSIDNVFTNLLDDPAVRGIVINFRDATEHKQITARLMMADRMVSVGTLAAGVAHEINNPLAYVIANLGFLETALGAPEQRGEVEAALREAQEGAERVRLIVRDLKTFSRDDGASPVPIDVRRVLDASANMAGHEIRQRAQLVKDYAPSLPPVLGSESQLGQVFVNLLVNAAQAIPEGYADSNEVRITTRAGLGEVVVEISDSGKGIPAEIRARLFDPFFTTKPLGVGTGLGLFVCQNIVTAAGGQISVESAPGRGSTFRVTLPTGDAAFSRPQRAGPSAAPAPGSTARILVVDDEPMIASAMRRALAGYTLVTETSARAALGRIERGERFDLILCDLMMPDMSGIEFHEALAARFPEEAQRIVFLTGGAFTPATQSFLARVGNRRLDKPFELHSLRALIEDHLAAGLKRA
jgi:PAS domain S-box-containing protein